MHALLILSILILPLMAAGQKISKESNLVKVEPITIRINRDSLNYEIDKGKLAFLAGCQWEEIMIVNGSAITNTQKGMDTLRQRRYLRNFTMNRIKKFNPDGTYRYLAPVTIEFY